MISNHEEFVAMWASGKLIREIAAHFNVSLMAVKYCAERLRRAGVKLPRHTKPRRRIDVEKLNKIIEDARAQSA